jgi:hypothetical protein
MAQIKPIKICKVAVCYSVELKCVSYAGSKPTSRSLAGIFRLLPVHQQNLGQAAILFIQMRTAKKDERAKNRTWFFVLLDADNCQICDESTSSYDCCL